MVYYKIKDETLIGIADAIRKKSDKSEKLKPSEMAAAIGTIKTGGNEFNIAYGNSAPEDTSKLWVKSEPPTRVKVASRLAAMSEELQFGVGAIPVGAVNIAAAAVGTKVYLFGGAIIGDQLDTINVWDAETYTTSTLNTKLPVVAHSISATAVGKKIYLFGGYHGSNASDTIYVFDTETNTIITLDTKLPAATARIASTAVGTKIYLFGGQNISYVDKMYEFDTETGTITTLDTKLPTAACCMHVAAAGTKIYLLGGIANSSNLGAIRVFDTETHILSTLGVTLPSNVGVGYSAAARVGKKIYLFGGRTASNTNTNAIGVFDITSHSISTLSVTFPSAIQFVSAAVVGAKVYLFGGDTAGGYSADIREFVAALPLERDTILIEASVTDNVFNLVANDNEIAEIGIANVYCGDADGIAQKISAALYVDEVWTEI